MSPANTKPSSSSPLAFTPTSVLRKMTAEKDFEAGKLSLTKPKFFSQFWKVLGVEPKQPIRQHMPLEPHSNWKPIEPVVPKPHQGNYCLTMLFLSAILKINFRSPYSERWQLWWQQPAAASLQLPARNGTYAAAQHDGHAEDAWWTKSWPPKPYAAASFH